MQIQFFEKKSSFDYFLEIFYHLILMAYHDSMQKSVGFYELCGFKHFWTKSQKLWKLKKMILILGICKWKMFEKFWGIFDIIQHCNCLTFPSKFPVMFHVSTFQLNFLSNWSLKISINTYFCINRSKFFNTKPRIILRVTQETRDVSLNKSWQQQFFQSANHWKMFNKHKG